MSVDFVPFEAERLLSWSGLMEAFAAGHRLAQPEIKDLFLYRGADTVLDRGAWIDGLGALVKVATIVPGTAARGLPTIHGLRLMSSRRHQVLGLLPLRRRQRRRQRRPA